jgi:hypothetical protein
LDKNAMNYHTKKLIFGHNISFFGLENLTTKLFYREQKMQKWTYDKIENNDSNVILN